MHAEEDTAPAHRMLTVKKPWVKGQKEGPRVPRLSQRPESARQLPMSTGDWSKETGWAGAGHSGKAS